MNFNVSNHDQMQVLAQEHGEFMDYIQKMKKHVEIHEEQPQKARICTCMHELLLNSTLKLILDINLQVSMNHARHSFNFTIERMDSLP